MKIKALFLYPKYPFRSAGFIVVILTYIIWLWLLSKAFIFGLQGCCHSVILVVFSFRAFSVFDPRCHKFRKISGRKIFGNIRAGIIIHSRQKNQLAYNKLKYRSNIWLRIGIYPCSVSKCVFNFVCFRDHRANNAGRTTHTSVDTTPLLQCLRPFLRKPLMLFPTPKT